MGQYATPLADRFADALSRHQGHAADNLVQHVSAAPSVVPRPRQSAELTVRQREVAELVAAGLTDQQIASKLGISTRTAESHVAHALARLGLANRAQIAAWVARQS